MNQRFLPGGDKYDECMQEDRRAFYERVDAEQEEISCWTDNEIEAGNNPTFENFVHQYPEWDHEPLHETIGEVMHRVKHGLPRTSEAV